MAIPKEFLIIAKLLLLAHFVTSYPSGAGKESCRTLRPRHNRLAQTGTGNYVISVPPDPIIPGSTVIVILSGEENFKGFLVQARKVRLGLEDDGAIIGTWENLPKRTQYRSCDYDKSSVTHSSPKGTKEVKLVWRAPSNLKAPVQFRATFVQSYSTFWVASKSAEISHAFPTPATTPTVVSVAADSACGPPPRVQHEKDVKFTSTSLGSTARYSCLEGFEIIGNEVSVCIPDGRWYPVPYCKGNGCGKPPKVLNAKDPVFASTTVGATVKYECDVNSQLSGSATVTCGTDGRWSTAPTCSTAHVCGQPPQIDHGKTIWNFIKSVGSKAVCTCDDGFALDGSYVITCLAPGVWSAMPNCKEITKQTTVTTTKDKPETITKSKEDANKEDKSDKSDTNSKSDDDDTKSKSSDDDDTESDDEDTVSKSTTSDDENDSDDDDTSSGSDTDETETDETETDETETDETETDETETDETETDETETDETETDETETDETETDETETEETETETDETETETDETETDETETDETETDETETDETETDETETDETETETDETETDETETDETNTDETETDETETETDETETDETETDETETDETKSTETESSSSSSSSSQSSSSSSSSGKKSHKHKHSHYRKSHSHGTKSYGYKYMHYRYKRAVTAAKTLDIIHI